MVASLISRTLASILYDLNITPVVGPRYLLPFCTEEEQSFHHIFKMHFVSITALLAFWHIFTASASCIHNTYLYQQSMKENEKSAQVEEFGYVGIDGPTNWHTIDPAGNLLCATGRNQSPINIIPTEIQQTRPGDIQVEIPAEQTLSFENMGTNVEVLLEGTTTIGSRRFRLRQFHYHTPGEHLINEEYFPIEVHMVHEAEGMSIILFPYVLFLIKLHLHPPKLTQTF